MEEREILSVKPFGKEITIGTPRRWEFILLFLYAVFFLWWDVLQNKVLDLGINYRVTWFSGITTSALDLAIIILILFHIVLMSLFVLSLKSKDTSSFWDVFVGTMAFFGVAIVLTGFVNSHYSETIRFMFINMGSTDFYHIGVFIEMVSGLYWAMTK